MCPGCAKQWAVTQCLECKKTSPHKDWYHVPDESQNAKRVSKRKVVTN